MIDRAQLLAARVPRYTSYPTAPQFHAGVEGTTVEQWLSALEPGLPVSLYVHIPFCDTLCWFCGCHTAVVNNYGPIAAYLDLVLSELDRAARLIGPNHPVTHIHWGGGSPTILSPDHIHRLGECLHEAFTVAPDAEIAVEIDPRDLASGTVDALSAIGVNRVSLGVQSNDPIVQRAVNRWQPFDVTQHAVDRFRVRGIDALNIDLMYGLPHQTVATIEDTVASVATLQPNRVALFGYAHLPSFKRHQGLIDAAALPNPEQRLEQFEAAEVALCAHGFDAIGIDHFAKPNDPLAVAQRAGVLGRNFQGYTTDSASALVGFGASAISAVPQGYAQNATPVPDYRKAILEGRLATARGIALSDEDRLRRAVIERLMCDLAVDLDDVSRPFEQSAALFAPECAALAPLIEAGIVSISGPRISVSEKARYAVRLVAAAFDRYLDPAAGRHAMAI